MNFSFIYLYLLHSYCSSFIWWRFFIFNELNFTRGALFSRRSPRMGILIYFIFFASILSYGIFYWLIKHTSVFFSSTWTYVSPIIALVLGVIVFNENIGTFGIVGSILILIGTLLSNSELFRLSSNIS